MKGGWEGDKHRCELFDICTTASESRTFEESDQIRLQVSETKYLSRGVKGKRPRDLTESEEPRYDLK